MEQGRNLAYPLLHRDFDPPEVYEWIGESGGGLIELPMRMSRIDCPAGGAWTANIWRYGGKRRIVLA